ncbi:MAG: hypothetical protein IJ038_03275 [Clostridia bacterium]|nr:hypothetical protein [Clostridia bacterium]
MQTEQNITNTNVVVPKRLSGETNDSPAIRRALDSIKDTGGTLYLCETTYTISEPIIIYRDVSYIGRGVGQTTIYVEKGADCDAFKSFEFERFVDQKMYSESVDDNFGPKSRMPQNFMIKGMTIDCGADFEETETEHIFRCTGNKKGYGMKIFGKRYIIGEVQIQNVPEVGFYTEFNSGEVVTVANSFRYFIGSRISVRVISSGEEGVIYRGPSDQRIDDLWVCSSCLTGKTTVFADREDWELAAVVFDDRDPAYNNVPYCASPELGFGHIWRGFNCWGLVVCGHARFKADHLIIESTNGGFKNSRFSYSQINMLDVHDCRFGNSERPYMWLRSKSHTKISNLEIRFSRETSHKDMIRLDGDNVLISKCLLRGNHDIVGMENAGGHGLIINGNFNQILGLHGMYIGGKGSDGRDATACTINGCRNIVRGIANDCTCGVEVNNPDNTVELTVSRDSEKGQKSISCNARPASLALNDFDRADKTYTRYPYRTLLEGIFKGDTDELQTVKLPHGLPFAPSLCDIVPVLTSNGETLDVAQLSVSGADEENVTLSFRLRAPAEAETVSVALHIGV